MQKSDLCADVFIYRHEWDCQGREKTLKEEENEREGRMLYIVVELRKVEAILITWFLFSQVIRRCCKNGESKEDFIIKIA